MRYDLIDAVVQDSLAAEEGGIINESGRERIAGDEGTGSENTDNPEETDDDVERALLADQGGPSASPPADTTYASFSGEEGKSYVPVLQSEKESGRTVEKEENESGKEGKEETTAVSPDSV